MLLEGRYRGGPQDVERHFVPAAILALCLPLYPASCVFDGGRATGKACAACLQGLCYVRVYTSSFVPACCCEQMRIGGGENVGHHWVVLCMLIEGW
mmetsp:Transcript_43059/g.84197  ORF Transcript_43059/g.84197 Transcript_43059/m.84197 type:complete len:96 (-) Transcript_43059:116-403(-)